MIYEGKVNQVIIVTCNVTKMLMLLMNEHKELIMKQT